MFFNALSDSTRRGILEEVAKGNPTVGELGRPFQISGPAISKHLKVLEKAQLVTRVREGTTNRFQLNTKPIEEAEIVMKKLTGYWMGRLSCLGAVLDEELNEE